MRRRETDRTKANCTQYTDRIHRIGGRKGGHWEVAEGAQRKKQRGGMKNDKHDIGSLENWAN